MGKIYNFLGLKAGYINNGQSDEERKKIIIVILLMQQIQNLVLIILRDNMKFSKKAWFKEVITMQ